MHAEDLLRAAKEPAAWLAKSLDLRRSANALWDAFFRATLEHARTYNKVTQSGDDAKWNEALGYLDVAKMLYGLAVETALKAHLLEANPASAEFQLRVDGSGKVVDAQLKQLGVPLGQGHDLVLLAEKAGVFTNGDKAIFPVQSDLVVLRDLLKHLTESIVWSGRYPAPTRSGSPFVPSPDVPMVAFQHYLRDWLDPLLDYYQKNADAALGAQGALDSMFKALSESTSSSAKS